MPADNGPTDFNDAARGGRDIAADIADDIEAMLAARGRADSGQNNDSDPIRIRAGEAHEVADESIKALARAGGSIYRQGGQLVRVVKFKPGVSRRPGPSRQADAPILMPVTVTWLTDQLARVASFLRWDRRAREYLPTDPSPRIAENIMSRPEAWPWPEIIMVIEAPTMRPDGTELSRPGYDPETGYLLLGTGLQLPPPPSTLNRGAATAAAEQCAEAFSTWPFVGPTDEAAAVAGSVQALLRPAVAPMITISSTAPGSGKSLLADCISILPTGRPVAVMPPADRESDLSKALFSALLAGDAIIGLDNQEKPLSSSMLCQVITQETVRDRVLGQSVVVSAPARATIIATGNGLVIGGDLPRRVMPIRLDARVERPEQRSFTRDARKYFLTHRAALIRAALTIPMAYVAAGCPAIPDLRPYGGFDEWDRLVRRAVIWAGLPDPLGGAEQLREDSPDITTHRAMVAAWIQLYGGQPVTAARIARDAISLASRMDRSDEPLYPALAEVVATICRDSPTGRKLGYWLRAFRGRVIDGHYIERAGSEDHAVLWVLRRVDSVG